jgi:drug/metabolite transporter (DMT)-like permease
LSDRRWPCDDRPVGEVLALLAALLWGWADFFGGLGARRASGTFVALIAQFVGLLGALGAVAVLAGRGPSPAALAWGALAGGASGVGGVALFRGLGEADMGVVAPLSGVVAAGLPVAGALVLGERLGPLTWAGVAVALPAILLVAWPRRGAATSEPTVSAGTLLGGPSEQVPRGSGAVGRLWLALRLLWARRPPGVAAAMVAGVAFAGFYVAFDRAGSAAGAWPLLTMEAAAVAVVGVVFFAERRPIGAAVRGLSFGALSGLLGSGAALGYLEASSRAPLAVVVVLGSLYPAGTVLTARVVLGERWSAGQLVGLMLSTAAITLIGLSAH